MFRNVLPIALVLSPALVLAACGPSREEELEKQLAAAKSSAEQEASARQQAESAAASARLKANDAELAKFYQGDADADQSEAETPPESAQDAAPDFGGSAPQPPVGTQADGRPIGDQMPAPR